MFDTNQTGTIDMNEFGRLFAYIQQWKAMFENFDRDRLDDGDDHNDHVLLTMIMLLMMPSWPTLGSHPGAEGNV